MIEINLLPEKMRGAVKKKGPSLNISSLPIVPIIIGVAAFIVVVQVIATASLHIRKATLNSTEKKVASIAASNQQVVLLDKKVRDLNFKVATAQKLADSRFKLAEKLNDLSDALVSGVWVKDIEIEKDGSLFDPDTIRQVMIIEGSSLVSETNTEGFVGNFVNSLKNNKSFYDDFDNIELGKVERKKVKSTEVLDFVIICHFKKGRGL